jgi:hypothetical protein
MPEFVSSALIAWKTKRVNGLAGLDIISNPKIESLPMPGWEIQSLKFEEV